METKKKKFAVPHTYVILIILVLICAIMTWLIPAGAYDRVEDAVTGKMVVDPNSFHLVEDEGGLGFFDVMLEFIKGMESASSIIFFIFIIGGAFTIIQDTGAMSASIHALVRKFGKKQNFILVLFIFLFSVLGGTMGMAEELIVFIPLLITLCNELKL
ncbi:MAG: C4-dicarboxylate ABC transporter permease, partial [Anaerovoracaceae bacterium]